MKQIEVMNEALQKVIDVFLCTASIIMLAVNLAQVIFRYVFHASILWSEELSTYLYVWIIFFSLYTACRKRNELNIAVIAPRDPKKMTVVNMIREICCLAACLALLAGSISMISNAFAYPQKTASLKIITAYLYFCMPICFALLSWLKCFNIVSDIRFLLGKEDGQKETEKGGEN